MSPTCSICICPLQYLAVWQDFSSEKDKPFHFPTFSICLSPGTSSHFRRSPKRRSSTVRARRLCFTFSFCLNHLICFPNSKNQQKPFLPKIHVEIYLSVYSNLQSNSNINIQLKPNLIGRCVLKHKHA